MVVDVHCLESLESSARSKWRQLLEVFLGPIIVLGLAPLPPLLALLLFFFVNQSDGKWTFSSTVFDWLGSGPLAKESHHEGETEVVPPPDKQDGKRDKLKQRKKGGYPKRRKKIVADGCPCPGDAARFGIDSPKLACCYKVLISDAGCSVDAAWMHGADSIPLGSGSASSRRRRVREGTENATVFSRVKWLMLRSRSPSN